MQDKASPIPRERCWIEWPPDASLQCSRTVTAVTEQLPTSAVGRATCFLPTWPVPRLLHRCRDYWEPIRASPVVQVVKNQPANAGDVRDASLIPGSGRFPWRRACQPIPPFLSGESHGQRSLAGYGPRGLKELDTIEDAHRHAKHPSDSH